MDIAPARKPDPGIANSPAYNLPADNRDLRIDFLRGLIMVYVILVHFEYFSIFSVFAWERLALVSSAEGFVFLSGIVVGMVYKKRLLQSGLKSASVLLWQRAFKLYRVNIYMILSISLLGMLSFVNVFEVTHWTHPWTHQSFLLFPPEGTSVLTYLMQTLLLRIGPHQYQVIGLYVVLLAFAPAALYLLSRGKVAILLLLSWILYAGNYFFEFQVTGARYEMAFPTLTWQLLFFHAMAIGYYRHIVLEYIARTRWLCCLALIAVIGFLFLTNNNQNLLYLPELHMNYIDPLTYGKLYTLWFEKTSLGLGRILNNVALFILAYHLLTSYWVWFERLLGWLLIPLGQNSLYVFTLHVYFLLLLSNTPLPEVNNVWMNSFLHLAVIFTIWGMVKRQILFQIIPR